MTDELEEEEEDEDEEDKSKLLVSSPVDSKSLSEMSSSSS